MDNQDFYKVEKLVQNNKIAVVALPESVLGGNDAMNFTNAIRIWNIQTLLLFW
jgi:hypothetical protein